MLRGLDQSQPFPPISDLLGMAVYAWIGALLFMLKYRDKDGE